MVEHRDQINDVKVQQHWYQICDRMQDRRLELDEKECTAVQERDRFGAAHGRENADLNTVATSHRQMRSHRSDRRANMSE